MIPESFPFAQAKHEVIDAEGVPSASDNLALKQQGEFYDDTTESVYSVEN